MKSRSFNNRIWYAILFTVFFILSCTIASRGDDFVYAAAIERYGSLLGWAKWFSNNWGGRVVPQGLLVVILQFPSFVFCFFNACAWVLLVVYAARTFDYEHVVSEHVFHVLLPALLFILIPEEVLSDAIFWKCANVCYLWGSATLLIAIYPVIVVLHNRIPAKRDYVFSLLAVIYTAGFEQAGALMCGAALLLSLYAFIYKKCGVDRMIVGLIILAFLLTFYFTTLPGNALRFKIEVLGHMPGYDMYSLADKALWGIWNVMHGIETNAKYLILLIAFTVALLLKKDAGRRRLLWIGSCLVFVWFLLCVIDRIGVSCTGSESFLTPFFRIITPDTVKFGLTGTMIIRSAVHFMAYVFLGSMILILPEDGFDITGFSFYFGGLASMWIMGFSPTIYVSGLRTHFLCYLFLLCVEIRLALSFVDLSGTVPEGSH